MKRRDILFLLASSSLIRCRGAAASVANWAAEIVDSQGVTGLFSDIAAGPQQQIHIAYLTYRDEEENQYSIRYATKGSGRWALTTVAGPIPGHYSAPYDTRDEDSIGIAVDSRNAAHVTYTSAQRVMYATNRSGTWVNADVDGGYWSSVAVSASGTVYLAYLGSAASAVAAGNAGQRPVLKYATGAGGAWSRFDVDSRPFGLIQRPAVAVDAKGAAYIVYIADGIWYATDVAGAWRTQLLDSSEVSSLPAVAIAVDGANQVHVAYAAHDALMYAANIGGNWDRKVVESSSRWTFGDAAIATDSRGKAHVVYTRTDSNDYYLNYATNSTGTWVVETFPYDDLIYPSICLDSQDNVHISCLDFEGMGYITSSRRR